MSGQQTYERLDESALDQHRQIHFFLERLEQAIEALDPSGADPEPFRRLPAVIDSFRERLEEHNRIETEGGLLQSALDLLPEAENEILVLTDQHDRIAAAVDAARIRAQDTDTSAIDALTSDLRELLHAIREHELAEERLLERALVNAQPTS